MFGAIQVRRDMVKKKADAGENFTLSPALDWNFTPRKPMRQGLGYIWDI
jgi:hypothetical protein